MVDMTQYYKKKMVVIYGNCHTEVISAMLSACPEFCKYYTIYPIKTVCLIDSKTYFELPIFRQCDVFIHQSIRLNNSYGVEFASEKVIKKLKPECRIISIPNLYHLPLCFFPQYVEAPELKWKGNTIFFRDCIVDEGYYRGLSIGAIKEEYEREDLFSYEQVRASFQKFMDKVMIREKDWDVKISEFILQNYKEHQLFYDPNHPTNFLLNYISSEVFKLLMKDINHCNDDVVDDTENVIYCNSDKNFIFCMDTFEMPICNAVKSALQINWREEKEHQLRCSPSGQKVYKGTMMLEQYIKQYCAMEWLNPAMPLTRRIESVLRWILMKIYEKLFI